MITYRIPLKLVATISTDTSVTEAQIRSYLADFETQATTWITGVIDAAPAAATASVVELTWKLNVFSPPSAHATEGATPWDRTNFPTPGLWVVYPKPSLLVEVANDITPNQVRVYLQGFYDDAKSKLRNLIAAAPPAASASITKWHFHPIGAGGEVGSTDEDEI